MPVAPMIQPSVAGRFAARIPSGMPIDDAGCERKEDESQLLERQATEVGTEELAPEIVEPTRFGGRFRAGGRPRLPAEKVRGDGGKVLVFEFGGRVHPAHRRIVDRAFELGERGPGLGQALREIRAIQQHRVVAREVLAVVLEHRQAILVELGVGRVDVDRVDLALGDGFVGEPMIEAARRVEGQLVGALQSRPAVGPSDEFLRQSEPHLGMRLQVGQPRDILARAHRRRASPEHRYC